MNLIKDAIGSDHDIWVGEKVTYYWNSYDDYKFYDGSKWGETCSIKSCDEGGTKHGKCTDYNNFLEEYNTYNITMKTQNGQKLANKWAACNDAITECQNYLAGQGLYLPKNYQLKPSIYVHIHNRLF